MNIEQIKNNVKKVNDYWLAQHPESGNCAWERSCYMLGELDAYRITGDKRYLDFAKKWAEDNSWSFFNDEEHKNTNADDNLCGEVYLDLIDEFGVQGTTEHMDKTLEWVVNDENNDYWWWVDTFYMALNFYNRVGVRNNDARFFDKAYRLYRNSKTERTCYDADEALWYRDERFLPDKMLNKDGKKIFWSRGNGWVFAGLARTLETLPQDNKYYAEYLCVFKSMAKRLKALQIDDGFWHSDLLSPEIYDMPEVSGTVLFALGMLKGINAGILGDEYTECAIKAYRAITDTAINKDGRIGWVQIVAWDPGPVAEENTNDYAVGTYIKVCRELIKLIGE